MLKATGACQKKAKKTINGIVLFLIIIFWFASGMWRINVWELTEIVLLIIPWSFLISHKLPDRLMSIGENFLI